MAGDIGENSLRDIERAAAIFAGNADDRFATDGGHEVALFFQQWIAFHNRQLFQRQIMAKQVILEVNSGCWIQLVYVDGSIKHGGAGTHQLRVAAGKVDRCCTVA